MLAADIFRLFQVVAAFCSWSGMRMKREKSVATGFVFKKGVALSTEGLLYAGAPLTGLAANETFAYLGVRASRGRCGIKPVAGNHWLSQ